MIIYSLQSFKLKKTLKIIINLKGKINKMKQTIKTQNKQTIELYSLSAIFGILVIYSMFFISNYFKCIDLAEMLHSSYVFEVLSKHVNKIFAEELTVLVCSLPLIFTFTIGLFLNRDNFK